MTTAATSDWATAAWVPSEPYLERSRLLKLMQSHGIDSVDEWRAWAAADIGRYWDTAVQDLGMEFSQPYSAPVDLSDGKAWPRWFVDGSFNYVHNALDRHATGANASRIAIRWEGDDGASRILTFADLHSETNRLANVLTSIGIGSGDTIGIFMPMLPETVVAVLACGKIGAVYTPLFSGFGADAVASRLQDCSAKATAHRGWLFPAGCSGRSQNGRRYRPCLCTLGRDGNCAQANTAGY